MEKTITPHVVNDDETLNEKVLFLNGLLAAPVDPREEETVADIPALLNNGHFEYPTMSLEG